MRDAVIIGAVRTPIGRRQGAMSRLHPVDLAAHVLEGLRARVGFDPADVDDVVWGCVSQVGEQALNIGRNAVLAAGWPESVPAYTVDRQCGSGQQAIVSAAAAVISGQAELVVAGGVEVMSRIPMGSSAGAELGLPYGPALRERYAGTESAIVGEPILFDLGVAAEMIARKWHVSRAEMDEFAYGSHQRAAAAADAGEFDAELVPVSGVAADECIRRTTSLRKLASLSTPFRDGGVVTAGTASQNSDGAAALAVTTSAWAAAYGFRPLARIHTTAVAANDPGLMLTAPIPATEKVLRRSGLALADIGVFEVNEAFACVPLAWLAETGADPARVNPRGGAIALGHPLGASGARIATTMLHYMLDRRCRYGLQVMCEAGGLSNATVLELLTGPAASS
ncbi:thiolase family protein [Pseudosporangium ferrugineum]|uniref:Acetyl-CoA acyltransferase n=1 Tax=Pseudosporangium ferrugineum TaxID=439699 RepID=A0A2T0SAQ0_9ACTN|nr:acetyl-CoA C-acyltransferase [Pseudosporangium ferrugineum]PRY30496.1 acetyl-CoA acyltransferase [Pseudosporangium ferrugineum]